LRPLRETDQDSVRVVGVDVELPAVQPQEHVGGEEGHALPSNAPEQIALARQVVYGDNTPMPVEIADSIE